jgi:hypothetical protein
MKILRPIVVTDTALISCTIPENDYAAWAVGTTYARGAFVISAGSHTVYRSLQAGNVGHNPDTEQAALADPLIDDPSPVQWQVISATNRWRLFDSKPSRRATRADEITAVIAPGVFVQGVAGFEISANSVTVTMEVAAVEVYARTVPMQDESVVIDWFTYFTEPIAQLTEFVLTDLPAYGDAEITITATLTGGIVSVGQFVVGPIWSVGVTKIGGTGFSGIDFSFVEQDEFGDLTTVQRAATRLSTFDVLLENRNLLAFDTRMRSLRGGTAAVWIGDAGASKAAVNYGFYRGYRNAYETNDYSIISIEVQGIV